MGRHRHGNDCHEGSFHYIQCPTNRRHSHYTGYMGKHRAGMSRQRKRKKLLAGTFIVVFRGKMEEER